VDRAMWHFVRGLAFAARRQADDVAREHTELARLAHSDEAKKLDNPQFPASSILGVANHLLAGKAAEARSDKAQAIAHFQKAIDAEDALPYMEPSYWPYPTRPTLGAALLEFGDAAKAEQIFREDLKRNPRNAWGLRGLEECLRIQGKTQSANLVHDEFEQSWKHADVKLDLKWF